MSLRKAVDQHCKDCIYDDHSKGNWRQQVTLCSVTNCALWPHRPKTRSTIPESVLRWYGVEKGDFEPSIANLGARPQRMAGEG